MGSAKFAIEKFIGKNDFSLWRLKMRAFLVHQGIEEALASEAKLPNKLSSKEKKGMLVKAHNALILSLGDKVLREVSKEKTAAGIWLKLEHLYMTKTLANKLYLKQKLYTMKMQPEKAPEDHHDDFNKVILDLENIEIKIDDEDQALLLLKSLPSEYDILVGTLIYGRESMTLEEVQNALCAKELTRKSKTKGNQNVEVLHVRGRSKKKDSKNKKGSRSKSKDGKKRLCFISRSEDCNTPTLIRVLLTQLTGITDNHGNIFTLTYKS